MDAKFRTSVQIPDYNWKIGHKTGAVFIGSCFTENVGQKMAALKFPVDINPFGILYNPVSVANGIRLLINPKTFQADDLLEYKGVWYSFYHHGQFSSTIKDEAINLINGRLQQSSQSLKNAEYLVITFGTAWVYRYLKTGSIVSNCHKIPAKEFERERLKISEIVEIYQKLLLALWEFNPNLKILFTVSPIRHWKDGAIENQRSKATLLLAVDELVKKFSERCAYFPSYEIVMDELRDYRFYAADMLHLNDVAIDFIFECFTEHLIDEESQKTSALVKKINSAFRHRPLNKNTPEFKTFLLNALQLVAQAEQEHPFLKVSPEKEYFTQQLHELEKSL